LGLTDPPARWGFPGSAWVLLGVLPHSSRWRGWIAESTDQPHLVEGLDQVVRRLGGVTRRWRFDQMSPDEHGVSSRLGSVEGQLRPDRGALLGRHRLVDICPSRHAWRKGAVEKSAHVIAQRWWRTLGDDVTHTGAQAGLDRLCVKLDARKRMRDGDRTTVGALADAEPLRPPPAPFPAMLDVERTVKDQALVAFRGNLYSAICTRSHPGMPARWSTSGTSWARPPWPAWTSPPGAACGSPVTCEHPTVRARWSVSTSTSRR
jgi:hypothetical protein